MNVNNMAFYISGPKLLFETTKISTHPNSTQQESNYIYLYTTKFGTSIKIRLNQKFESTEFEKMRVNCIWIHLTRDEANDLPHWRKVYIVVPLTKSQSSYQARFQMHGNSKMPLYCPSQEMTPLFKCRCGIISGELLYFVISRLSVWHTLYMYSCFMHVISYMYIV